MFLGLSPAAQTGACAAGDSPEDVFRTTRISLPLLRKLHVGTVHFLRCAPDYDKNRREAVPGCCRVLGLCLENVIPLDQKSGVNSSSTSVDAHASLGI